MLFRVPLRTCPGCCHHRARSRAVDGFGARGTCEACTRKHFKWEDRSRSRRVLSLPRASKLGCGWRLQNSHSLPWDGMVTSIWVLFPWSG